MTGRRSVTDDEREGDRAISALIASVCFVSMSMILAGVFVLGLVVGQLGR